MQNSRTLSYQQAADELRTHIVSLYGKKIFPRMGKIFADQLFLTVTEAGGFLSALADLDEIHVKRDTAQCALIRLKRADYILKTMVAASFYTSKEADGLIVFFKKIIPAVRGLLVEVYGKIDRDNAELLAQACSVEVMDEAASTASSDSTTDPDGFYDKI